MQLWITSLDRTHPALSGLLALFALSAPAHAALSYSTEARCIDDGVTKHSEPGGSISRCEWTVNRAGLNARSGSATGSVMVVGGPRRVGINATTNASLTYSAFPTVFGTEIKGAITLTDRFRINSARDFFNRAFDQGMMEIDLLLSGSISMTGSDDFHDNFNSALLNYSVSASGSGVGGGGGDEAGLVFVDHLNPGTQLISAPISLSIPWEADVDISVLMSLDGSIFTTLTQYGSATGSIQFGNTLEWLGISKVTDVHGNPAAAFTAMSPDTGVVWGELAAPVPVPAPVWLFAAGLPMLWRARRRHD
jgi:hypothetical protein